MNKGWLELESDPGLFTLLVEDFGVPGIQVEEIYDLQKSIEGPVYGFIFLFKWIEERRARRKIAQEEESFVMDEEVVNSMFFAHQVISNSCATHALLSVLLNCDDKLKIGETLTKLKKFTNGMSPEDKGFAIGNVPDLARAHNSHARPESRPLVSEKQQGIPTTVGRTLDAFHFVSYVPINGRLFELDGLKPHPIDHGPWGEQEDWTEKFRRVISERLGMATGGEPYHDIRFNLMAVVPDKRHQFETKLNTLKTNRYIVLEALQQMVKVTDGSDGESPKNSKSKSEPIMTRSVRAKEANCHNSSPLGMRTRSEAQKIQMALDGHNYAKSPVMPTEDDDDDDESLVFKETELDDEHISTSLSESIEEKMNLDHIKTEHLQSDKSVKIAISVSDEKEGSVTMPTTVANTDITKPLIIQTKFGCSPGPLSNESTDTASEVGSGLSSPVCSTSAQISPSVMGIPKLKLNISGDHVRVIDPSGDSCRSSYRTETFSRGSSPRSKSDHTFHSAGKSEISPNTARKIAKSKFSSQQGFTPKDLLALLKNVEQEICTCENNLRDEIEKRKKFRVDDCRRTHNYDQFICTFLSMLAEQGHLASLVEQHSSVKVRTSVKVNSLHKIRKPDKRRRAKPKPKRKR